MPGVYKNKRKLRGGERKKTDFTDFNGSSGTTELEMFLVTAPLNRSA
jgi:hypothetical protein